MKEQVIDINALVQDDHNFNKGTEAGRELMEKSFKQLGAGRSVLIDKDGRIIAGNKSQKAAIAAGIKKVRIIETTGDELVAVKRTDISLDSKEGRELALADNLTTQVNLAWDEVELQKAEFETPGFDVSDFGFDIADMPEVQIPTAKPVTKDTEEEDTTPDSNNEFKYESQYGVIVMCSSEEEQEQVYNQLTKDGYSCKVVSV